MICDGVKFCGPTRSVWREERGSGGSEEGVMNRKDGGRSGVMDFVFGLLR